MKSALYFGTVRHRRFQPKRHAFSYQLLYFFLDLQEIERLFRIPLLFARRGPSVLAFRRANYLGDPSRSLDEAVRDAVTAELGERPTGPIRLLTQISYFGFCFNPISLYYCYDARDARVEFIVAQVTNTPWHERHTYVVRCQPGAPLDFVVPKKFHVSPFMPMALEYRWRLSSPGRALNVHMENHEIGGGGRAIFDATMTLERRPLTAFGVARGLLAFPLLTIKAYLAIYLQAALLFLKRFRFYGHPTSGESS